MSNSIHIFYPCPGFEALASVSSLSEFAFLSVLNGFLCGSVLHQDPAAGARAQSIVSSRPKLLRRGQEVPENSGMVWCLYRRFCSCTPADPSVHLLELQAAAFFLISLFLLHPHSGPWVAAVRSDAEDPGHLLYPSVNSHGWLETCGHPGQANHLASLQQEIVNIYSKQI